jgi:Rieske Fe-S protein
MSRQPPHQACAGCGSCVGRRDFLRVGLGAGVVAALATMVPSGASATSLRSARAVWTAGDELRYPLPATDGVSVDRSNEVILARYQGEVVAFALSCPHQRSLIRWRDGNGIFQCSKHHSEYSPTGVYQKGRATRNMDRLAIRLEGTEVVVNTSTPYHSDEDPQGWSSAVVEVS